MWTMIVVIVVRRIIPIVPIPIAVIEERIPSVTVIIRIIVAIPVRTAPIIPVKTPRIGDNDRNYTAARSSCAPAIFVILDFYLVIKLSACGIGNKWLCPVGIRSLVIYSVLEPCVRRILPGNGT